MIDTLEGYLAPSEAARRIGVAPVTLRWWVQQGKLPALRTPNGIVIRIADVEDTIRRRAAIGG